MTRAQLEHLLRAAGDIASDDEIIVIGSQSILGQFPDAPASLLVSAEADVYPKNRPERADLVDGSIGEGSPFHDTYGYYAQGVGEETAVLPSGWKDRLIAIHNANTRGVTGWTLEVHDLLVSKYVAGREKDREFCREVFRHKLANGGVVLQRLAQTAIDPVRASAIEAFVRADATR